MRIRVDILRDDLARSRKRFEAGADRVHTEAGKALLRGLVRRTPVDIGKLVSNWRVGLGQPTRSEIEAYEPGELGSTANANRNAAIAAGEARIGARAAGKEIFISNSTSYQDYVRGFEARAEDAIQEASAVVDTLKGRVL